MLNTSNIKTQGDMILAIITAVLPNLQSDQVNALYNYLVDMGVENADDLAFIQEDDLNRILKPIQSRKLIAAWKNKGIPNYSTSLPKRNYAVEPVTFVPAVFQIPNTASQNLVNDKYRVSSSEYETPHHTSHQNTAPQSVHDVCSDFEYATSLDIDEKSADETPLMGLPSKNWIDTFKIPWERLPKNIMNSLSQKKRLTRKSRFKIIHTICNKIFEITRFPLRNELETIAKEICKRFPASLDNRDASWGKPGTAQKLLTDQFYNRFQVLRKNSAMAKSDISSAENDTSPRRTDDFPCPSNRDCAASSADGDFIIPWHKMDKTVLESLNKNEKLSILQRQSLVRTVCEEFDQWGPKSQNLSKELRKIAERMVKKYPSSLSNASLGLPSYKDFTLSLAKIMRMRMSTMLKIKRRKKKRAKFQSG